MSVTVLSVYCIDPPTVMCVHVQSVDCSHSGLLSIFDEDGYQMISGDQKESQPDKNTYIHTVTVSVWSSACV